VWRCCRQMASRSTHDSLPYSHKSRQKDFIPAKLVQTEGRTKQTRLLFLPRCSLTSLNLLCKDTICFSKISNLRQMIERGGCALQNRAYQPSKRSVSSRKMDGFARWNKPFYNFIIINRLHSRCALELEAEVDVKIRLVCAT